MAINQIIFPFLRWHKTRSFWKRLNIIAETIISIWVIGAIIIFFYFTLTYDSYYYKNFTFHLSNITVKEKLLLQSLAKKQLSFLKKDILYSGTTPIVNIYFVRDSWVYTWIDLPATLYVKLRYNSRRKGFTVYSTIVINNSINKPKKNIKTSTNIEVEKTLTHELVHVLQNQKYGVFLSSFRTPNWVSEGYATYRTHLYSKTKIENLYNSRRYKNYAKLVKYAIEIREIDINLLHLGQIKYKTLKRETIKGHP